MSPVKTVSWRAISVAPVILVSGPQDFFAERAIKNVRDQLRKQSENLEIVEAEAVEYVQGQVFDLASAGLFGDSKLVVFEGAERCSDSFITDMIEYLKNPSDEAVVIIRHNSKSVRGKKFLEAIRASDIALEATCLEQTKEAERLSFVEAEFSSRGRKIQRAAAQALIEIFGKDFEELSAACSQLQNDDSGEVTLELVQRYFGGRLETDGFKIADAAFEGRGAEALLLLRHSLSQGVVGVLIISAFERKVKQMANIIGNPRASAAALGVQDWVFEKIRKSTAGWTEDSIARVIHQLADTDFAVKGGEGDANYALERLVSLVANKGKN